MWVSLRASPACTCELVSAPCFVRGAHREVAFCTWASALVDSADCSLDSSRTAAAAGTAPRSSPWTASVCRRRLLTSGIQVAVAAASPP